MIIVHPILMKVTARTDVGVPATGGSCGFASGVRICDTGARAVSSADTGPGRTGVRFRDAGGGIAQRSLTVREALPAFDRAVQLRAEHVAAATEPVGPTPDAADLLAVQEAGLLELGDHLAGLLPAAAELLGELRGVGVHDEAVAVIAGHADQGEQGRE